MKSELERYEYKRERMERRFDAFSEALEDVSVAVMGKDFKAYKQSELYLEWLGEEVETYSNLGEQQRTIVGQLGQKASLSRQVVETFKHNDERLSRTEQSFDTFSHELTETLSEAGFRLVFTEERIKEMKNDVLLVTVALENLEGRIDEREEELAGLLDIPGREERVAVLGEKLNEIEKVKGRIQKHRLRLEKIIRLAKRDLRGSDYYWIGPGFPEKKFDNAFDKTDAQVKLLLANLEELLEQ